MLSFVLAVLVAAAPAAPVKYCQLPCPTVKAKPKPKPKPPEAPKQVCCPAPVVQVTVEQHQSQKQFQVAPESLSVRYPPLGLRGALGVASCLPGGVLGLLGVRFKLPWHLGAEAYTEFYWGHGLQALVYPVLTPGFSWHLNAGGYWVTHRPYVAADVPRQLDLTLGTGLEFQVLPHLYLTADLRTRVPNPVAMSGSPGLRTWPVVGNSALQSQVLLGLMISGP